MDNYYKTINVVGDLVEKLYEKFFLSETKKEFEKYFKLKKNTVRITYEFFEDIQIEREEIGESIDPGNYNHIEQLRNKELHPRLFEFYEKMGIDVETFLKLYH